MALCVCVAGGVVSAAHAHDVERPRVLVITPRVDGLEVRVSEMWPAGESSNAFRRALDADRDGMLGYEERERVRQAAAKAATARVEVRRGREVLDVEQRATKLRGAVKVEAAAELSVDVGLWVALEPDGSGLLEAAVSDWRADDHDVEAVVVVPEGIELVKSSQGTHDAGRVTGITLSKKRPLRLLWRESR